MTDVPAHPGSSSAAATAVGKGNTKTDTTPEKELRSLLHQQGYRFRKNYYIPLEYRQRGINVDIVFLGPRVAVFVDGCFWHCCPEHGTQPSSNAKYWTAKLDRNRERDLRNTEALRDEGWEVIRVWEHEDPHEAALKVARSVDRRTSIREH